MRIKVCMVCNRELNLPIAYHYCLQSAIYSALKGTSQFNDIHDEGYSYEKRKYKGFTFSDIYGKYRINGRNITFFDTPYFYISSPNEELIQTIASSFQDNGISLLKNEIDAVEVEFLETPTIGNEITIKMLSPVCIRSTDAENRKSTFYNPGDKLFGPMIMDNFQRKYRAYNGEIPFDIDSVKISPVLVVPKHKKIMSYKGIIYEGWLGQYKLSGDSQYLKFLYDAGIGSENSKGMGMFEIIE